MKKRLLSPCALPTVVITLTVLAVSLYCVRFISAAGTTLGDLATSMQPGSWVAVPQTNIDSILGHGTRKGNNLPYSMSGKWDSVTHRLHFLGADDGEPHIYHVYYDEATNSWVDLGFLSGFGSAPGIHGYDQLALDPVTRQLYFNPYGANPQGTKVYRYFLASNGPWNFASQYTPSGMSL